MGSLVGKSPADTYKSLLKVTDETNGITSSTSNIEDGEGTASCTSIGTSQLKVTPATNTTTTFEVENSGGTNILTVDTTNNCVKVGSTQTYTNTQLLEFASYRLVPSAGTHYFVPCSGNSFQQFAMAELANGTGTDPDTTFDAGDTTDELVNMLFLAPANIAIDSVKFMVSTDTDTDTTINVHLCKFTMTNSNGTSDGNLSGGTVLANGQATGVDRNVIKTTSASVVSSSVSTDEVIACFVENETNTDDINLRVQVLYHIV